jgi:hypothetical protein
MAQTFPATPQIIYNTLVADGTFMANVGSYTFKGGAGAAPAISILTPGKDLPSLESITGLEVVIHDVASMRRYNFYEDSTIEKIWNIYLIAWDDNTGDQLTAATERAMLIFSGSNANEIVASPDGISARVQTLVTVPSDRPILTI